MTAYCMLIIFHISWDFPGSWIPRDFLLKLGHFWSCYETCDFIKTLFYQASSDTPLKGKGRWNSVIASWGTEVKIPHLASINAQRRSLFLGQGESSGCLLGLCRTYARWKGQSWLLLSPVWPLLTYWGDGGLASVPLGSGENPDFPVGPSATRQAREGRRLNTTRLGPGPDSHTISNNYGRAFAVFNKNFVLLHIFLALQRFFLGLFLVCTHWYFHIAIFSSTWSQIYEAKQTNRTRTSNSLSWHSSNLHIPSQWPSPNFPCLFYIHCPGFLAVLRGKNRKKHFSISQAAVVSRIAFWELSIFLRHINSLKYDTKFDTRYDMKYIKMQIETSVSGCNRVTGTECALLP